MSGLAQSEQPYLLDDLKIENEVFLTNQLITYIGNKRNLLYFIRDGLEIVRKRLSQDKLSTFDVFSGSGIVARFFKKFSNKVFANDMEKYSKVINECYLSNTSELDMALLREMYSNLIQTIDRRPLEKGFISRLYSPKDDENIKEGERVFYTHRNAMYIDTVRRLIDGIDSEHQKYFLAPLLSEASIHANTSGVFKGFYKCKNSGTGKFGGSNEDALCRIKGDIELPFPVFSNFDCDFQVFNGDSNKIVEDVPEVDVAYLDPPYNQHPYGSNYFMLNLILDYKEPITVSKVSGIPLTWKRSSYNKKADVHAAFEELLKKIKAKFLLISFNSEGFIATQSMLDMLSGIGKVHVRETKYNTFRGSRNLRNRSIHVKEYLYLVEKN